MDDPYEVLSLDSSATEEEIRATYLRLVRDFPPERHPEMAAKIRAAYDALRDPVERLKKRLFELRCDHTLEELIARQSTGIEGVRFPTDLLLSLGRS